MKGKDREEQVEVEREKQVKEGVPWMTMEMIVMRLETWAMRCETTSSVKECALRARSSDVHVALVVSLVVDAVVGLTLGVIAHVVVVAFDVAILHRIFLYGRYSLYICNIH